MHWLDFEIKGQGQGHREITWSNKNIGGIFLPISGMPGDILMHLTRIIYGHVHVTPMTFSRSWMIQRSGSHTPFSKYTLFWQRHTDWGAACTASMMHCELMLILERKLAMELCCYQRYHMLKLACCQCAKSRGSGSGPSKVCGTPANVWYVATYGWSHLEFALDVILL